MTTQSLLPNDLIEALLSIESNNLAWLKDS